MYFQLTAPNQLAFKRAYWEADIYGLNPEVVGPLTFDIGTGNIEKVSRIRDKYNLSESSAEYQPTGYWR